MNETAIKRTRFAPAGVIASWVALAATVLCNALFEYLKLGGTTAAEVSDQVFTWFTPAGYAFSIWAVIYLAMTIWLIAITKESMKPDRVFANDLQGQQLLFIASCALNVAWLALFHFQHIAASLAVIIVLWATLALLYTLEHRPGTNPVRSAPISIYLSWISVATIANSACLVTRSVGEIALLNEIGTVGITVVVLLAGYAMARISNDNVFPLVLIWATVAVGVHLLQVSPVTATAVFAVTAVGAAVTYLRPEAFTSFANRKHAAKQR